MSDHKTAEQTPWGETYDDLANSAISDPAAPIVLQLAAVKHRLGVPDSLRSLVADAVTLDEKERRHPKHHDKGSA